MLYCRRVLQEEFAGNVKRKASQEVHNLDQIDTLMNGAAFRALNALCKRNPEIFAMGVSPEPAKLNAFYPLFMNTNYVKGMFASLEMRRAIAALEKEYLACLTSAPPPYPKLTEWQATRHQKTRERKVRFVHRVAVLLGPDGKPFTLSIPEVQRKYKATLVKSLVLVNRDLPKLMVDDYFQESLHSDTSLDFLKEMVCRLPGVIAAVESAKMQYPIERKRNLDNARFRQFVNRIADACYRIYGNCEPQIVLDIAGDRWDGLHDVMPELNEIIETTLDRKVDRFNRRVPNEDYVHADLCGGWGPARTLDPPWMADSQPD